MNLQLNYEKSGRYIFICICFYILRLYFTKLLIFKLIKFTVEIIGYIIYNNLDIGIYVKAREDYAFFKRYRYRLGYLKYKGS